MRNCDECKTGLFFPEPLEASDLVLCGSCGKKIKLSTWKDKIYNTNKELLKEKNEILSLAEKNGFSEEVKNKIKKEFDERYIDKLVYKLDGHFLQTITLTSSNCILNTESGFDYKTAEKAYIRIMTNKKRGSTDSEDFMEGLYNTQAYTGAIADIAGDLFGKGIKKTVTKTATSLAFKAIKQQIAPKDGHTDLTGRAIQLNVLSGEFNIDLSVYTMVSIIQPQGDEPVGFIRFQNPYTRDDYSKDIVFFFLNSDNIKQKTTKLYESIQKVIYDLQNKANRNDKPKKKENIKKYETKRESHSVADDIRKFKVLLDEGILTEEEFNAKKKQLLGL